MSEGGTLKTSTYERIISVKATEGYLVVLVGCLSSPSPNTYTHPPSTHTLLQYADSTIELFKVLTLQEVEKKEKKKARKAEKKGVDVTKVRVRFELC